VRFPGQVETAHHQVFIWHRNRSDCTDPSKATRQRHECIVGTPERP
jgi:hypothetical protein